MTSGFFTFIDRSAEKSTMSFMIPELAADGSNYIALKTLVSDLKAALLAVTEGAIAEESFIASRTRLTNEAPADGRRETKWLVRVEGDTSKKVYTIEIPCADDTTMPLATNSDFVDFGGVSAVRDALVAAIEAGVLSPYEETVTVLSIELVGRNT